MLAPRSYTREDVIELQCHGSEVCLHRVLRACLEAGARLAEPGLLLAFYFHSIKSCKEEHATLSCFLLLLSSAVSKFVNC